MPRSRVVVVGGGLAGMVVARELASRGRDVLLLEKSKRLGGKAGANGGIEHGYHIFPPWYPNVRKILTRLGVPLIDFDRYHYLLPGKFPEKITIEERGWPASLFHNTFQGMMPWYQTVLFFNFVLEMISKPLSQKRLLDRVSQIGLMREAWYVTEQVAELNQENLLKASAIPAYEMSAMTAKKIAGYWVRTATPLLSVLPGDLQSTFIAPLEKEMRSAGVEVRLGVDVKSVEMKNGRVAALKVRAGGKTERIPGDLFAITTPLEVTRRFVDGPVHAAAPSLGNTHLLQAQPMSSMHVKLKRKISGVPREHVFLHGGEYGLSFIDVSQVWKDYSGAGSYLSFIASNFAPLESVSDDDAIDAMLEEIYEYLPISKDDLDGRPVLNSNVKVPLFINTIGAWEDRPDPQTGIPNLVVAGDWVRNAIDLACMEGAVSAALAASAALLRADGETGALPEALVPPVWNRALLLAGRVAFLPVVGVSWAIARVAELFSTPKALVPVRARNARRKLGRGKAGGS